MKRINHFLERLKAVNKDCAGGELMSINISIIVPIYNLEEYLSTCVDSILGQTFTNFELILVNDGSTDKSGEICDQYARNDKRVKVIHKRNGGTASSRNAGLSVAQGEYIGFVDNDDYIHEDMFKVLYEHAIKHSSDIIVCDFIEVPEGQYRHKKTDYDGWETKHFNNIEALQQLYTENSVKFVVPWNKLYKRYLFEDVEYAVGYINDDETVIHKLLYNSKKVTYLQAGLYFYVQRTDSQVHSPFKLNILGAVYTLKQREVFFREKKEYELNQKALKHYMEKFFWYYYLAKSSFTGIGNELKALKRTFNQSLIYLLKHNEIGWKQKGMCTLFWIHPSIFEFVRDGAYKRKRKQHTET